MQSFLISILICTLLLATFIHCIDPTCRGKRVNEICSSDEDCEGQHIRCVSGRCACPLNFDQIKLTDKITLCKPAPGNVGDTCTSSCKAPLLCQNGKCVCFGGTTSGTQCVIQCTGGGTLLGQDCRTVATSLGGKCSLDIDCQIAGSFCNGGRCDCIAGATKSGSSCTLKCPDGTQPTQTCSKTMVNDANALANGEHMNSCPKGYGCFTYGKPDIGHCCKLYCPYGSPDLSKSCEAGASSNKCPDTHFCQFFDDRGTRDALCCPNPCHNPTPLYINGKCLPKAHWNDACKENGQCEGGLTMQCSGGRCVCQPGFAQVNETYATCNKACNLLTQANIDGACYNKVNVGDPCLHSAQCPRRSICREGICLCDCNSALSKNTCVDPDDPGGTGKLTEIISGILSPAGGSVSEIN